MRIKGIRRLPAGLTAFLAFALAAQGDLKAFAQETENVQALERQVRELYRQGKYEQAIRIAKQVLEFHEKTSGPEHPDTATSLHWLAVSCSGIGDYARAEPLFQRELKIRERALGSEHPDTATSLHWLAASCSGMGDYARAEPLYLRALEIREKALGPEHPDTAANLNDLAELYRRMGDYAKAEPLCKRALMIREKVRTPEHADVASSLNSLAELYKSMGDYAKAEPLCQRALMINEKVFGLEHPDTATSLNNLAQLYIYTCDYAKAEPLLQRSLKIDEKVFGREHRSTATTLDNLAWLYQSMGDDAKAEPLYERALKIDEKALGPEHPYTATTLDNLAVLYEGMRDYAKAEPLLQRSLKIDEKVFGPEHPQTATSLNNLALLYIYTGDYAKAEPLLQRSLKIDEKVFGPEHPQTATGLNNLAGLYQIMSNYAKADPLLRRALKIDEKVFGLEHPGTAHNLDNISLLLLNEARRSEAMQMATQAQRAHFNTLADILSFTSEPQRLAYTARFDPYALFASMGNGPHIALAILRCKGVVLDSLLEDRLIGQASANTEERVLIGQMLAAKQRAYHLMLEAPKDLSEAGRQRHSADRERAQAEVERLEGGLARHVAGLGRARRALSVTVEEVQSVIPKQGALIELLRYRHYLGTNKWEARYGAIILASTGEPKWVSLGSTSAITTNVARYYVAVRRATEDRKFSALLKELHKQIWSPIEQALSPDTKTVIIGPDAELNFVSFATLLTDDDQFLGQKYSIRYVSSGRDLLRETKPSASSEMLVYANPDFSGKGQQTKTNSQTGLLAMRSVEMRDFSDWQFLPLPGTSKESDLLESQAKKWNWPVKVFSGATATEAQLDATKSPRILHLATHGFFLPDTETKGQASTPGLRGPGGTWPFSTDGEAWQLNPKPHVILKNPMHRSGLALAGAQATLEAWKRGEVPPTDNDGIVTAEEVGGLKLEGTWLVTLSACDTGTGEARSGEGVLGLRRGFIQAGAQNLLMTLWPVADEETPKLMKDFYASAHEDGNAPKALAEVQRDSLVKLRKERGLVAAVRIAGPFVLTSQGKVE